MWKNDCPVVLVHGFGGQTTDKSFLIRGYFHYAQEDDVCGDNLVYEADVSPFGSHHDRACELYQQLVGASRFEAVGHSLGCHMAELVYGETHFYKEHKDSFYKRRYLRRVVKGKILAFPDGITGGWCKHRKVHLIGHS